MTEKLTVDDLYRVCDPSILSCDTSEDAVMLDTIIGQERAVRAMRFGLDIKDKGFNIYVAGSSGSIPKRNERNRGVTARAPASPMPIPMAGAVRPPMTTCWPISAH